MSILLAGSLTPVHEKAIQESYRHADSKWFTIDYNQSAFAMRELYSKYDKYLPKSYLQRQFSENFTLSKMTEKLGEYLGSIESKISTQVAVNLPKLKKKESQIELPQTYKEIDMEKKAKCPTFSGELHTCFVEELENGFKSYLCFDCGYTSNSALKIGTDQCKEETQNYTQLVKDLKIEDEETGLEWYPSVINMGSYGFDIS